MKSVFSLLPFLVLSFTSVQATGPEQDQAFGRPERRIEQPRRSTKGKRWYQKWLPWTLIAAATATGIAIGGVVMWNRKNRGVSGSSLEETVGSGFDPDDAFDFAGVPGNGEAPLDQYDAYAANRTADMAAMKQKGLSRR